MVKISINELKNKMTTAQSILEKNIKINKTNIEESISNTILIQNELENLREALVYKQEQIKAENTQYVEFSFEKLKIKEKNKNFSFCDFHDVVDKQNEVTQLDLVEKYMRMEQEIEMGGTFEDILERVFANQEDELEFWCFFLSEYPATEALFAAKKKTEEKILEIFEQKINEVSTASLIYRSSFYLNQGYPLIKLFINRIELLQNPKFVDAATKKVLNFDSCEIEKSFGDFLTRLKKTYENDLLNVHFIFFDHHRVVTEIGKRIFDDLLAANLDRLLRNTDAPTFLVLLSGCYAATKKTCDNICEFYSDFNDSVDVENIFLPFVATLPAKEKAAFDGFFSVLVLNRNIKNTVVVMGEKIEFNGDFDLTFKKLVYLLDKVLTRYALFPSLSTPDYFFHFFRKFNEFISNLEENFTENETLILIKKIGDFCLILKNYCTNTQILGFEIFSAFCESKINSIFDLRVEASQNKIKILFDALKITNFETENEETAFLKKLILFLSEEIKTAQNLIFGPNAVKFINLILSVVYVCMRKKIQLFQFGQKEAGVLLLDVNRLLDFVRNNSVASIGTFEYLVELVELVSVGQEDICLFVANIYEKIPDSEIKIMLKCRKDYNDIKDVFNKLKF